MRDLAAATAMLLRQGRNLDRLSRGLTLVGALSVFLGPIPWLGVGLVLAGVAQSWFAFRVGFDAALFAALGRGDGTLASMDAALMALGLMPESKTGRDITLRASGAKRLLVLQVVALLAQIALCVIAAGLTAMWNGAPV
ncbi:MAG: hypothetical protein JWO26_1278 [Rhodospirillales bacterium]|jgi:hypothetical protein|nr:hypothetical protein [Rhodospirillales bacterium]